MIEDGAIRAVKTEAEDMDADRIAGVEVEVEVEAIRMIRMMLRIRIARTIPMTPMGRTARVQRENRRRMHRRSQRNDFVPFELFVKNGKVPISAIFKKSMEESQDEKIKALQSKIAVLKAVRDKGSSVLHRIGMSCTKSSQLRSKRFNLSIRILGIVDLCHSIKVTSWSLLYPNVKI